MSSRRDPTPDDLALWAQEAKQLRADFPAWAVHHHVRNATDLPWEAKRHPSKFPPGGGVGWLRADTADLLRELLAEITQLDSERAGAEVSQ
ncbi:hypothetical protein [Actinomadura geliboluensis]|uniref:hypothetical protein n=1 Tax=Actinomadura geliboluensis TaxID=882440 RepID=UPI00371B61EC